MAERSPLVDLVFNSFPASRGNPESQRLLMSAARHVAPNLPVEPYGEYEPEIVAALRNFTTLSIQRHPSMTEFFITGELQARPGEMYRAFQEGLSLDRQRLLEDITAHQIESDHRFMIMGDHWDGYANRGISVARELIINPSAESPNLVRIDNPVFRQVFSLLARNWRDPESRARILAVEFGPRGDITSCDIDHPSVGGRLDHVVKRWEARNHRPFYG